MLRRLAIVLLSLAVTFIVAPGGAVADDDGGEARLWGSVEQPEPVEGLRITAYSGDTEVATTETDSDGAWEMELPEAGEYRVVLDEDTVPDEYVIANPGPEHASVTVRGESRVIFNLGEPGQEWQADDEEADAAEEETEAADEEADAAEEDEDAAGAGLEPDVQRGAPFGERLAQTALTGLLYGLIIALCSIGLSLIFGTTRMINFAHGDLVTFGALFALMFTVNAAGLGNSILGIVASVLLALGAKHFLKGQASRAVRTGVPLAVALVGIGTSVVFLGIYGDWLSWSVPVALAAVLVVALGAALGGGMEHFIWRPLRKRHVALIQMFIVSIGFAILLRHVMLVMFGGGRMNFREYRIQEPMSLGPFSITPRDLTIMVVAIVVLVAVASMLQFTRIGKAMRAVSDNRDLAESSGINVDRVTLYVWMLGGGLAALGGVLFGLNVAVFYEMGFFLLLLMFAAVILGGLGTAYGAMVGGIFIGLIAQLSTLWFPIQLMEAWALALMIVMLLVRPQGILGRRERVG
ncbi:branched-chain amino acid ABC transporter permease [Spiractinospora alimapuensis]|uniref:branched-chain amino acid ABC transporter permease n=1 Tax=Spiractinospora alimapuensis TaxID=2820884 RepID=UPI001F2E8D7D|nr:branched-chain amino acid ABC transporter permease [Spiractinospora alimapuensis]QVQ53077.1 branched-chain amino acid ABC transporter permease [Spiractinospora alimapuensis]